MSEVHSTTDAEKLVAEWRSAMEGVTPGPWRPSRYGFQVVSDYPEPAWQSVVELTTIARSEPNVEREMLTQKAIANWIARCSPSGISGLLALIESQRATIERVEREKRAGDAASVVVAELCRLIPIPQVIKFTGTAGDLVEWFRIQSARVTALEAEKAGLVEALADPVVVHRNMLAGSIAKPSTMNIAHLYPEVQQMRQALIATLKHFRHPTSAEHETRDKVMAALSHFDDPPLTPYARASLSSTEKTDD